MSMNRKSFFKTLAAGVFGAPILSRALHAQAQQEKSSGGITPLHKSNAEWKKILTREQYGILREEDTEYPGTSALLKEHRKGTFICAGCFLPLFDSDKKFESGTGWPSFFDVIPGRIAKKTDMKLVYPRSEYHCARCGGHQGHVFNDGPQPTGLRYCNNGVALAFVPDGQKLPALRT